MKNTMLIAIVSCLLSVTAYADFRVNVSYGDHIEYRRCNPIVYTNVRQSRCYVEDRTCYVIERRPRVIYVQPCERKEVVIIKRHKYIRD